MIAAPGHLRGRPTTIRVSVVASPGVGATSAPAETVASHYGGAMAVSDGNGWVECRCGNRHWGRYGSAGLLALHSDQAAPSAPGLPADARVLLQHRAPWSHLGDTWGVPGGARDSHEDVVTTALRETWEETGLDLSGGRLLGVFCDTHPDWSYTTVIMSVAQAAVPTANAESVELRWVPQQQVPDLPLHPGLAAAWETLAGPRSRMLVDVANVMGARPDGWWRDRLAGAQRVIRGLEGIVGRPVGPRGELVSLIQPVVEGAARGAVADHPAVLAVAAPTADEFIAESARAGDLVVTADRELRERVRRSGAVPMGPGWLWEALDAAAAT